MFVFYLPSSIPFYLGGYKVCITMYCMVLGHSTAALNETFQNFHVGVKALQTSTCKKQEPHAQNADGWNLDESILQKGTDCNDWL